MVLPIKPHHREGDTPLLLQFGNQLGFVPIGSDFDVGCIDVEPQGLSWVLLDQFSYPPLD